MQNNEIKRGDKVKRISNGKTYIFLGKNAITPEYAAAQPKYAAFWEGRVYIRNINPKTGEGWQAPKNALLADLVAA